MKTDIVLDTNVLVTALRSSRGASFRLLSLVEHDLFTLHVSTPLVTEYEAVLKRGLTSLSAEEIDDVIDYLCSKAVLNKIFYLWRPVLKDSDDDFVLELAVKANATIVTWNVADFKRAARFGVDVMTPREFLATLEVQP
jgi:putative PIN family toxin of toxin-antitoxin system